MGRITHFEVHVDDFDRATKFYAAVLDWQFQKWDGPAEYVLITTGPDDKAGINGGMVKRRGPIDGQAVTAFVCTAAVDDVDATIDKAVKAVRKLPPERQDEIGAIILEELVDEERWAKSFAASQDALAKLADEALADRKAGRTTPLEFSRKK